MARSRKTAATGGVPIVTYSHVPAESPAETAAPRAPMPESHVLDAVEVPLVADDATPRVKAAAPDLRADLRGERFEPDEDIAAAAFEPERRSGRGRLLILVALIAIAGGAGAIASSLGVFAPAPKVAAPVAAADPAAEMIAIHKEIDALGEASTPAAQARLAALTKRLAELEQSGALVPAAEAPDGDVGPTIRKISLSPNGDDGIQPATPAAPPSPRPRPEKLASQPPADETVDWPPVDNEPAADRPVVAKPARAVAPKALGKAPSGTSTDANFIESVEKALSDSQSKPRRQVAPAMAPAMGVGALGAAPASGAGAAPGPSPLPAPAAIAAPPSGMAAPGMPAPLPPVSADAADPYALPAPIAASEPPPTLPPGVKLPPADIPNVAPGDVQY